MSLVAPSTLGLRGTAVTHFNVDPDALQLPADEQDYEYVLDCKTTASKDHVLLALSDRTIQARSRATLSCERQFTAHTDTINELVISETQPWNVISGSNDGTIKVWDLRQSQPAAVQTIRVGEEVWSCSVGCGDTLVVAGAADSAVFFDLRTLRKFHPVRRSEVITASDDGIVCLFDCTIADEDEATISTINVESSVSRFCMFGPDLHNIAVLTGSETLDVWNLTTAERLAHFPTIRDQCSASSAGLHTDYLVDCKYNAASDQLHLATGNHQGQLNVFQLNPQAGIVHQATLSGGHKAAIRCLDWQADMLLTGGEDARVCQWMPPSQSQGQLMSGGGRSAIRSSVERDVSGARRARHASRPY